MLYIFNRIVMVLAVVALCMPGCDDGGDPAAPGEGTPGEGTSVPDAGSNGGTTGDAVSSEPAGDAGPSTGPETTTEPVDPCAGDPCQDKVGWHCEEEDGATVHVQYAATCTANGEEAECAYDQVDGSKTSCGEGEICDASEGCLAGGNACDYTYGERVSLVTAMRVAGEDCCFDFGGSNGTDVDNGLGALLTLISSSGALGDTGTIDDVIKEQIDTGELVLSMEMAGLDDVVNDESFDLNVFLGSDSDDDFSDNLGGTGSITVDADAFIEGTAKPAVSFKNAMVSGGVMTAGPGLFQLTLPLGGIPLSLKVSEARIQANLSAGTNGLGPKATEAQLGGVVLTEDIVAALNLFTTTSCACLTDLPNGEIARVTGEGKFACEKAAASTCDPEDDIQDTCETINSFCGLAATFMKPDIDSDGNGISDSLSLGILMDLDSVTIDGTEGCGAETDGGN